MEIEKMVKKSLVAGKNGVSDAVACMFGVLDCEIQLKTSRVHKAIRRKLDRMARNGRHETKQQVALREQQQERIEMIRAKHAHTVLALANNQPGKCRKLLKVVRSNMPTGHKIVLVPGDIGFRRQLVQRALMAA